MPRSSLHALENGADRCKKVAIGLVGAKELEHHAGSVRDEHVGVAVHGEWSSVVPVSVLGVGHSKRRLPRHRAPGNGHAVMNAWNLHELTPPRRALIPVGQGMVLREPHDQHRGLLDEVGIELRLAEPAAVACSAESAKSRFAAFMTVAVSRPVTSAAIAT